MPYSNQCPICGKHAQGKEKNETRNFVAKVGAKSLLKRGGQLLGGALGTLVGAPDLGQQIGGRVGSMAGGKLVDQQKKYAYFCSCTNIEWFSDDVSRAQIIRRHYDKIYQQQCKPLPVPPKKGNNLIYPLIGIFAFLSLPYIGLFVLWIMAFIFYLMTFTFLDLMQYVNGWFVDLFIYSRELYVWIIGIWGVVYIVYLIIYWIKMAKYNKEKAEVISYNEELHEQLNNECKLVIANR